jgi:hypothetical protein
MPRGSQAAKSAAISERYSDFRTNAALTLKMPEFA